MQVTAPCRIIILCCIILNFYTGTPLGPVDYALRLHITKHTPLPGNGQVNGGVYLDIRTQDIKDICEIY